jgi:hypothetical protein
MPTTYSPSLRIALLGNGENSGTWGQLTNTNLGTLLEQSITGVTTVSLSAGNVTLTSFNGVSDQSRNAVLVVTGTQTITNNVIIPNAPKTYLVNNTSSFQIGIQASGGSTYICPVGTVSNVYCDGAGNVAGASVSVSTPTYQTFVNPLITGIRETITVSATAAAGAITFYTLNQAVGYYTLNATGNWTINFTGNAVTTLNSLMSVGQSFTATFMATQGATAYYNNGVYVDGTLVTAKWQNGITPTAGSVNGVNVYTYAIIKTGAGAFSVFASTTQFA